MKMIKINKHIEIVHSTIVKTNSLSQRSCDSLLKVLKKHYMHVGVITIDKPTDLNTLKLRNPDLVFLGMKFVLKNPQLGIYDPDKIWVADYLDELEIPYTGSLQNAHEVELNKNLAKQRILLANLNTSPFILIKQNQTLVEEDMLLNFPVFIKPSDRGGGLGINAASIANNFSELKNKVLAIAQEHGSDSLIEEYLPGREFSVAILKNEHNAEYSTMPLELIAPVSPDGTALLSKEVKASNTEEVIPVTDPVLYKHITELALNAFYALGARDYGRIDIKLDDQGVPNFLEANLLPSLIAGYGSFPKACVMNLDLNHEDMILKIVRLGFMRQANVTESAPSFMPLGPLPILVPATKL